MTKPTDIHTKARKARFATKTQILDGALYLEDPKTGTLRRATDEEIHSFLAHYPHRAKELAADVAETYEKFLEDLARRGLITKPEDSADEKYSKQAFQEAMNEMKWQAENKTEPPGGQAFSVQVVLDPSKLFFGVEWKRTGSWLELYVCPFPAIVFHVILSVKS